MKGVAAPLAVGDIHVLAAKLTRRTRNTIFAIRHAGQVCDEPAALGSENAEELLAQRVGARYVELAADRHDGAAVLAAHGKYEVLQEIADFVRLHIRPPISVPGRTRLSRGE